MSDARRRVTCLLAALMSAGCSTVDGAGEAAAEPIETPGRRSSSIVLAQGELVVVDPDVDSISILDREELRPLARIDVGDEPRQLLLLTSGELVVSTHRGGELVFVDLAARRVNSRVTIGAGPFGMALRPNGALVVACEYDHRVVEWTPSGVTIVGQVPRVRAVATAGGSVFAASFVGTDARVYRFDEGGEVVSASPVPNVDPKGSPTQLTALLPAEDGGVWVAMQLVDNGPSEGPAGYGELIDESPRVKPLVQRLSATLEPIGVGTYARFDGGALAFNAPSALEFGPEGVLIVAHRSSSDLAVIGPVEDSVALLARVGSGPAGLAVDLDEGVIYVDNAFDGSVSRVELGGGPVLTRVRALPYPVSAPALAGRRTFHDARDGHMTPLGVVACSTCHPEGGDDGLTWHLHAGDVTPRRRRSMHLGVAPIGRAGLHWDGEFGDMQSLVTSTITNLMGGDALLVDSGDLAAYLTELVRSPPPRPHADRLASGRAVFERAGCATCHSGARLTDDRFHAVLSPMTSTPGDMITTARTPSLLGVGHRAPYFHDGRSPNLHDLHRRADAGVHRGGSAEPLMDDELADLVAYLESL